jgi:uncharacterized protein YciI
MVKQYLLLLIVLLLIASSAVHAQKPESKLVEFQMALLKRGPNWNPDLAKNAPALLKQHLEYVQSLLSSGQVVIAGPVRDESNLAGVYIFRAKSAAEAKSWVNKDPAVLAGVMIAEMHPWWSEDVMKKPVTPLQFTTAYLALLVRGEKWTPEVTPQTEEIQKGHMANIHRLADMKKLVVAGPFGDDGTLRGIFVFRVNSLDEARDLTLTDPAVKAGRLALELHPWLVPEGILP